MKSQFLIIGALALVVGTAAWADPSVDTHSVDTVKGHKTIETPSGNTVEVRRVGQTDGDGNVVGRSSTRVRKHGDVTQRRRSRT